MPKSRANEGGNINIPSKNLSMELWSIEVRYGPCRTLRTSIDGFK